jgi:hypothetical protein
MKLIMKNGLRHLALLLSAFLLTANSSFADSGAVTTASKPANWLFIQLAESGSLEPIAGEEDTYLLQLKGISDETIAFTDQPERSAQRITIKEYLATWHKDPAGFDKNPPNAALEGIDKRGSIIIFTLNNPRYDEKLQTLSYKAKYIAIRSKNDLLEKQKKVELPKIINSPTLFIDDSWGDLGG